jgi:hypothetical protein
MLPLVFPGSLQFVSQNPFFSMAGAVPFFDWSLSAYKFTLLLQTALIVTFGTMALRRWKSASRHSLSKPYALAFLCGFITLFMGNLWPAITGQHLPFPLFGNSNIAAVSEFLGVVLPLVYSLAVWLLCIILFAIVIPSHQSYVRGIRRALKLGKEAAQPWDDDAASLKFMGLFLLVALVGFWILFREISAAGFLEFAESSGSAWRLPAALALVLLNTVLLVQVLELKPVALVILLLWFLPILAASVFSAAAENFATSQAVLASLSPLALLVLSGLFSAQTMVGENLAAEIAAAQTGIYTGFAFIAMQTGWLWLRWRKLHGVYRQACLTGAAASTPE